MLETQLVGFGPFGHMNFFHAHIHPQKSNYICTNLNDQVNYTIDLLESALATVWGLFKTLVNALSDTPLGLLNWSF